MSSILARDAGPGELGVRLVAVLLTLSLIAFLVVLARIIFRVKERNYGGDDICSGFAALLFIMLASAVTWSAVRGVYNPSSEIPLSLTELGIRTNTVGQALLSAAEALGKISIALLQIRIMTRTNLWKRVALWVIIAITTVFTVFTICVTFFQCKIPKAVWDLPLKAHTSCWSPAQVSLQAVITSSWFTAVDFILALFPVLIFWNLQLPLKKKIAILVLLGLGCITGVMSALKTSELPVLAKNSTNSAAQFDLQLYSAIELFLLIVLGCVPVMKTPWEKLMKRAANSSIINSFKRLLTLTSRANHSVNSRTNVAENGGMPNHQPMSVGMEEMRKTAVEAEAVIRDSHSSEHQELGKA